MSVSACIVHSKHRKQHTVATNSDALPRRRPTIIIVGCLIEMCAENNRPVVGAEDLPNAITTGLRPMKERSCDRNDDPWTREESEARKWKLLAIIREPLDRLRRRVLTK